MHRVFAVVVALTLALPALAADCLDYTDYLHVLGTTGAPTAPTDVAVAGDLACVTDSGVGLTIFDVADPREPRFLAAYQASTGYIRVVITESFAWISDNQAQLIVISVADPTDPRLVATRDLPGNGRDFHVAGNLLLVACSDGGLAIFDIADPEDPQLLSTLDMAGTAYGVSAAGDLAIIAASDAGLHTVDIADPGAPQRITTFATVGAAFDVELHEQVAHLAVDDAGLELVAVADPSAPVSLAQTPLPGFARRLHVDGPTTYVAAADLHTIDTSDPFGPVLLGRAAATSPSAIAVSNSRAYLADSAAGLVILEAINPASPTPMSTTPTTEIAYGLATDGPLTYLAAGDLIVYDHTDPNDPQPIGSVPIPGNASRIALAAGHAYVTAAGMAGLLYVVDIADPTQPVIVNEVEFPGFPGPILAHAGALFLGDFFYGGLYVLDLADPTDPQLLPTIPTGIYAIALAAHGDRLFVATGAFGGATIELHDISDPLAPALVHTLETSHQSIDGLVARGELLFATPNGDTQTGLTVLDYTQPTAPIELAHLPLPGVQRALAVVGETAHVVSEEGFFQVIDIAAPDAPTRLGETFLPAPAFSIATAADRIHAAATYAGLTIVPGHCDSGVPVFDPGDESDPPPPPAALLTAYPNPFNPQITLRFDLPRSEPVTLDIFDLTGRHVARLVAGQRAAGRHTIAWRPDDLPSGSYLARLETPSLIRTSKLVLLR